MKDWKLTISSPFRDDDVLAFEGMPDHETWVARMNRDAWDQLHKWSHLTPGWLNGGVSFRSEFNAGMGWKTSVLIDGVEILRLTAEKV